MVVVGAQIESTIEKLFNTPSGGFLILVIGTGRCKKVKEASQKGNCWVNRLRKINKNAPIIGQTDS
jgi:hypothetical protein